MVVLGENGGGGREERREGRENCGHDTIQDRRIKRKKRTIHTWSQGLLDCEQH